MKSDEGRLQACSPATDDFLVGTVAGKELDTDRFL